jgi:hypothetical protein
MEGEFRTLLSAIRRIISPAGKSIFLSIEAERAHRDLEARRTTGSSVLLL